MKRIFNLGTIEYHQKGKKINHEKVEVNLDRTKTSARSNGWNQKKKEYMT